MLSINIFGKTVRVLNKVLVISAGTEQFLTEYLSTGWIVASVTSAANGDFCVVLQKFEDVAEDSEVVVADLAGN